MNQILLLPCKKKSGNGHPKSAAFAQRMISCMLLAERAERAELAIFIIQGTDHSAISTRPAETLSLDDISRVCLALFAHLLKHLLCVLHHLLYCALPPRPLQILVWRKYLTVPIHPVTPTPLCPIAANCDISFNLLSLRFRRISHTCRRK